MAITVGQKVFTTATTGLTTEVNITRTNGVFSIRDSRSASQSDAAISYNSFNTSNTYYLTCTTNTTYNGTKVYLVEYNSSSSIVLYDQVIAFSRNLEMGINNEFIFTPFIDSFNHIVFQKESISSNEAGVRIASASMATINNQFSSISAKKIGIQAAPGTIVVVNHEPMMIGQSGILEINNGIPITFFGLPKAANVIVDYMVES